MRHVMTMMATLILLTLSACATMPADYEDLKARVAVLEKAKAKDTMLLAEQAGLRKFWWKNNLTGGTSSDLDGIATASLADGDAAIVAYKTGTTTTLYFYIYDIDETTLTESSPTVISPDDAGGTGVWILANLQVTGITGNAADGYHYWEADNTTTLTAAERAQGRCWFNNTGGWIECYHSSAIYYWAADGTH